MSLFKKILAAGIAGALATVPASAQQGPNPKATAEGHGGSHSGHGAPAAPSGLESHPFVKEMDRDMSKMMEDMHAPGYSGNWDIDFLTMMIPHHQGAIDMARLVLIHGKDPLTRTVAEEIIASQQAEIEAMKARLIRLKQAPTGEFPSLEGTRGATASAGPNEASAPEPTPGHAPAAAVAGDPLFINLTTSDPHRAAMAVSFAAEQLRRGHPVTVFLNDNGVLLAADRDLDVGENLAELIRSGAAVYACPFCLKHHDLPKASLLPGIKLSSPDLMEKALFAERARTLSW